MKYEYDLLCIGLGPAGMAVSIMGAEMGLKVCAIEKNKIGGECMNVGCIPSKSLLQMARARHTFDILEAMELCPVLKPDVKNPFKRIREYITYINDKKTVAMFDKVDLILGQGGASFVDPHTVAVGDRKVTAKRIFIATGTHPMVPPIPGIETVDFLTNENMFELDQMPKDMVIIGGGAIGSEMGQAFSRLGTKCSIVQMDPYLIPVGNQDAGELLEKVFKDEHIDVYNNRKIDRIESVDGRVRVHTDQGDVLEGERLLIATGRKMDVTALKLENAGVKTTPQGVIAVDNTLRTSQRHIYAVGDCNGAFLLTHAAMHQGMIALMNSMMPFKQNFRKFVVPWTVFTEPAVSHVGMTEKTLKEKGLAYEVIQANYGDYGAAIAENLGVGFVKVYCSPAGKIYGTSIVGDGSGEMINEWALAIQKKMRMHDIMFLQHSFPTMGFLTKRTSEMWMMKRMRSETLRNLCRFMFRL
ncbi:MAG: NAD(P)/FAD-dependent oxidoreductase [Spartobacteria bacterium]|nr:NAD(P)/FAD-dependent oxidoreductase [Spartobacteria bacterium]